MRKRKILYVTSSLKKTGPNIQLYNLVNNLNRINNKIILITLSTNPEESLLKDFKDLGIEVIESPVSKWSTNYKNVYKKVHEINPDIIHSSGIRADKITANLTGKYFTVSTIHNYMFLDYPMRYGKILGGIMVREHIKYLNNIKQPIVCSISIKEMYKEKIGKVFYAIENGVDTTTYCPVDETTKNSIRKKLNIPLNKKVFISTGHLSSLKDPSTVLKAFSQTSEKDQLELIFLGDGKLKPTLELEASLYSNIKFMGRVNNVVEYLQSSDVFISASHTEGLPNAVLEAMACNLGLILSEIPPHREIYSAGETRLISFPIGDDISLLRAIEEFKNEDTDGYNNNNMVEKYFSAKIMAEKYEDIYAALMDI